MELSRFHTLASARACVSVCVCSNMRAYREVVFPFKILDVILGKKYI